MKKLAFPLLALPILGCLLGCNSTDSAATGTVDTANSTSNATVNETATTEATNTTNSSANSAIAEATPEATSASTPSAKKTYRVVDESQPGMPPEVVAALKKAKVPPPPAAAKVPDKARVTLQTSKGDITVELNGKAAPLHVKSFLHLAGRGFYNGTRFHRYEPDFVIQGGDPLSKDPKLGAPYASLTGSPSGFHGGGGPGYQVPREYNSLKHEAMALAAARTADPDSAGSQFYFTLQPVSFLDQEQSQDGVGYTVYGKVTKGQDVVRKLRANDVLKKVTILK